jgi:hypothetical protein
MCRGLVSILKIMQIATPIVFREMCFETLRREMSTNQLCKVSLRLRSSDVQFTLGEPHTVQLCPAAKSKSSDTLSNANSKISRSSCSGSPFD